MKKILCLLLVLLMLFGGALADGMAQVNHAITIDGVRTAFFAPEGAYLQPMEKDGLLYVPVEPLGENLGIEVTADPDTLAITVRGVRAAFFSPEGAFLPPVVVNGIVYVPLAAFAETAGIGLVVEGNTYALATRPAAASTPAPTPTPAASTPVPVQEVYGYVALSPLNFTDFFTVETSYYIAEKTNEITVTYTAVCEATTSYGLENVQFSLNDFGWIDVPSSGRADASYKKSVYSGKRNTKDSIIKATEAQTMAMLKRFSLTGASGKLRMSYQEAERINADYYRKAEWYLENGAYAEAVKWYQLLGQVDYLDSKTKLTEARRLQKEKEEAERKAAAEKKAKEDKANYEKALALMAEGDYAGAEQLFKALGNYEDSAKRVAACQMGLEKQKQEAAYQAAAALEAAGDYIAAREAYLALGDYSDAAQRAAQLMVHVHRQQIDALMAEGKYQEAQALLANYAGEEWAQALIRTCNLRWLGNIHGFNADGTTWVEVTKGGDQVLSVTLMDIHGNLLLPEDAFDTCSAIYARTGDNYVDPDWQDSLCLVKTAEGPYGYINTKGEMAIPAQYLFAQAFHQGCALVRTMEKQYQVIDTQGNVLCKLPEKKDRSYINYVGEGLVTFDDKGKVGLIDLNGKVVLNPKYNHSIGLFEQGLATATATREKKGTLEYTYTTINPKGKEVKLGKYTRYTYLAENLYAANTQSGWIFVDQKGKQLSNEVYTEILPQGDVLLAKKYYSHGVLDLNLNPVVSVTYVDVKVGYEGKVAAITTANGYAMYDLSDMTTPLLEDPRTGLCMNPDSPYIAWKKGDLGWFVYDSQGNLIH